MLDAGVSLEDVLRFTSLTVEDLAEIWAPGEEAFLVDKIIIMGRPDEEETLLRVDVAINKKYRHADGTV